MTRKIQWPKKSAVTVIGLGAVGTSLVKSLKRLGWGSLLAVGHGRMGDRRAARELKVQYVKSIHEINQNQGFIIIAVGDSQIRNVVHDLVKLPLPWRRMTILHTSGVSDHRVLGPLARRGAAVAAWHPYQTFPKSKRETPLKGATFGITGNPRGEAAAAKLSRALGGRPVRVPAKYRALYHASAVFACGFVAADLKIAVDLLRKCGFSERRARDAALAIASETLTNVEMLGPRKAMTGPAVRGDKKTMNMHVAALKKTNPRLAHVYQAISKQQIKL